MAISRGHGITLSLGAPVILASAVMLVIFATQAVDGPPIGRRNRVLRWVISGEYVVDDNALFWARVFLGIFAGSIILTIVAVIIISQRQWPRNGTRRASQRTR